MQTTNNDLRFLIEEQERQLLANKSRLTNIERTCQHEWSEPKRGHIEKTEFRNGAMIKHGIDFWYEQVPYKVSVPIWERTCANCGKREVTEKTQAVVTQKPKF